MTLNHNTIRELLAQLIELPPKEKETRLEEIQNESPELFDELQSLLPFTEGDRDDLDNDPFIGECVGHFTIKARIGSGGMGRVYLARQENPDRDVALKVLRRGLLSRSASKRFEIECRLLGRLHHGGIAQVYEAGTHIMQGDRIPWIAMEYIEEASPLTAFVQDNNLDINAKLELFKQVCGAVAEAHRHGIIHRDLKPANILVDSQGNPKIIDFGVAKAIDPLGMPTALITQSTDLVGTMQYMSPEQAGGESVDITSDIYSLGVILYEMLAGQRPYDLQSTTITGAIETLKKSEPVPLRAIDKTIHRDVETVVARAMMHDHRSRYLSANELCDDIVHVLDGEPISARKESALARFLRRKRRTAAAIVFALPILAIATSTSVYFAIQAEYELRHKTKLIEFAKDALATRSEIIVTNPEYWKTHTETIVDHARATA
ncbi:MAG: serine/threonine protein kinase, partial [Planctomycetes bacterium]|nr:serine/threonine protein kinase [Planctomycetota bacterium]